MPGDGEQSASDTTYRKFHISKLSIRYPKLTQKHYYERFTYVSQTQLDRHNNGHTNKLQTQIRSHTKIREHNQGRVRYGTGTPSTGMNVVPNLP